MDNTDLIKLAIKASKNSYSKYSNFKVGAALLCKSGRVYLGTNIENKALSTTVCAERVAIFKAVSDGEKEFDKIAIIGGINYDFSELCYPCGSCRQVISEFCDSNFKFIIGKDDLTYEEYKISEIFPHGFNLNGN